MAWMLVHPQMHNTFAALGGQQGDGYRVGEDCLAILVDILSTLSVEDRTQRSYRRAIGVGQHVRKDLVPLLIHVKDDARTQDATQILDATIKLLVNLTVPVECLLATDAVAKTDAGRHAIFEINKMLYSSKEAFVDARSIKAVTDHMKFVIERGASLELEQCDSINNCLLLLRNVLHIPEHRLQISSAPQPPPATLQNRILWNLFTQSIDKLLLHLITYPQKVYWVLTLVQLISLLYKDQHVSTLQRLLALWWEAGALSDSSEDNESNTSPPGAVSPAPTSTEDSEDTAQAPRPHALRSRTNRHKVLVTADVEVGAEAGGSSSESSGSGGFKVPPSSSQPPVPLPSTSPTGNLSTSSSVSKPKTAASEASDYGYGTQVENQESLSTSSNEEDAPRRHKPHMVQKPRGKTRVVSPQERKELRRKKLIKRSKVNITNIKCLLHRSPTDADISAVLQEFTVDFLVRGYGPLVHELHAQLLRAHPAPLDTSHVFWLVTYFLRFAAQLELEFHHLRQVLTYPVLAYLVYEGVNLVEELQDEDCEVKSCLRRMHLMVTAIREFLLTVETYQKLPHLSSEHQATLRRLQLQISKCEDLRCLLVMLIRQYNPEVQSRQYLQDLVTTNHALLLYLDTVAKADVQEHLKHFGNVEVMQQYGLLLQDFDNNSKFMNDCVFTMMHHIGGDVDSVATLFQPSILKTFSKIWDSDYEICDDWSDLIEYVIHKFINVPSQPCPVTDSPPEQKIQVCTAFSPQLPTIDEWTEEEIDSLYWYFVQSRKSISIIANIESLYNDNGLIKSRQSIIKQLLQQNIISESSYDDFMKQENIDADELDKNEQKAQDLRDIEVLKEQLATENQSCAIPWLQKVLLDACHCKMIVGNSSEEDGFEPVPYCYTKLLQSIPLVPWYKEHKDVLQNKSFISLVHKLGFDLPCDTMKLYVRIPYFWTAAQMFDAARKLGPIHTASLKFDVSALDTIETRTVMSGSASSRDTCYHTQEQESIEFTSFQQMHDLLPRTLLAVPATAAPPGGHFGDFEHNSVCDTASVTSDLTRMYVSDEDDIH